MKKVKLNWNGFYGGYNNTVIKRVAPEEPGIYLLWHQKNDDKLSCFYVGKAINLKQELLDHLSYREDNKCIKDILAKRKCDFEFALVKQTNEMDGIIKYLVEHYDPQCNQVINKHVMPVEVNIL